MTEETEYNQANEPFAFYESKDLKIYSNVKQASEAEKLYVANQDPIERIKETVLLILRVFPLKKNSESSSKIFIDRS